MQSGFTASEIVKQYKLGIRGALEKVWIFCLAQIDKSLFSACKYVGSRIRVSLQLHHKRFMMDGRQNPFQ